MARHRCVNNYLEMLPYTAVPVKSLRRKSSKLALRRPEFMEGISLLQVLSIFLLFSTFCLPPVLSQPRDFDAWAEWPKSWPNQGGGTSNRRNALFETKINTESVTKLSLKWTAYTKADVSSTASIDACGRGAVYFSSWDGCQYAVTKDTGELIWKVNLTEIGSTIPGLLEGIFVIPYEKTLASLNPNLANLVARSTPTIAGPLLIFGIFGPCYILALNRTTGAVVWWSSLDLHPFCVITQSGTYHEGAYYIGTSSMEEVAPVQTCCYFQGAFFKLDAKTGKTLWRVGMMPDNHKKIGLYAGAAVWGSSPSIDIARRLVYIATGNAYSTPPAITACEEARLNETNPPIPDPCLLPDDHEESIVAINIDTGVIAWSTHLGAYDTWTLLCQDSPVKSPNCPPVLGQDYDFGEAPFLLTIKQDNGSSCRWRDVVICGQKSGVVHTLDRATGEVVWQTAAGPGGTTGGASWGMTTDGERVFTNIINSDAKNFTLVPSSTVITWGGWVCMNASTGAVLWSTANPVHLGTPNPVAHVNGVIFGGSQGNSSSGTPLGQIVALDAVTGAVLWEYTTQGGLAAGVSILDGCIIQPVGGSLSSLGFSPSPLIYGHSTISLCIE